MDARSVERAETQLRDLRLQSAENLALAAVAFGAAAAGTRLLPALAPPLLVGGVGVAFLGMRALVRRYLLVGDLASVRDAYVIPEVRQFGLRTASMDHRLFLAGLIRAALECTALGTDPRIEANRGLLGELEAALENEHLTLGPQSAVVLDRLLDASEHSLYTRELPADELRSRLRHVLVDEAMADVKEGTRLPFGAFWAKEHYDWSDPSTIRWTVQESNFCAPGSFVSATLEPRGGGGTRVRSTGSGR